MFRLKSLSGCNCRPVQLHCTLPCLRICETTWRTVLEGMANPRSPPTMVPSAMIPTTSPAVFTSGPPECPGLMDASV